MWVRRIVETVRYDSATHQLCDTKLGAFVAQAAPKLWKVRAGNQPISHASAPPHQPTHSTCTPQLNLHSNYIDQQPRNRTEKKTPPPPMSISLGDVPKSILKTAPPRRPVAEARKIALAHASSLQIRKALEASILESLTRLVEAAAPVAALEFKHHIRFFTAQDYDGLVEERNILDRCGYVPCVRGVARRKVRSRLARAANGEWVDRRELERYCGDACRRKALWVRVQLAEEPAWNRHDVIARAEVDDATGTVSGVDLDSEMPPDGWTGGVTLLEEQEQEQQPEDAGNARMWTAGEEKDVWKLAEDLKGVGIGEHGKGGVKGEVLADVVERRTEVVIVTAPKSDGIGDAAAIEGFVPKARKGNGKE